MVESYQDRFGKKYVRKLIKDEKFEGVDIYDVFTHITKPENVTSFRGAIESLMEYMIKDDWDNDKRYFEPFFQEWFEKEILARFNFNAHFESMRQHRKKLSKDAELGIEAMCEIDAPDDSKRQVLVDYIANQMDGHTIFKKSYFEKLGCDKRVITYLSRRHWSNYNDYKSTYYDNDGSEVPFIEGIYGSSYINLIINYFNIKYEPAMGRGTNADRQIMAIREYFDRETIR